jgi:hypothetical protein
MPDQATPEQQGDVERRIAELEQDLAAAIEIGEGRRCLCGRPPLTTTGDCDVCTAIITTQRRDPTDPLRLLVEFALWADAEGGEQTPGRRQAAHLAVRDFLRQRPHHKTVRLPNPTTPDPEEER